MSSHACTPPPKRPREGKAAAYGDGGIPDGDGAWCGDRFEGGGGGGGVGSDVPTSGGRGGGGVSGSAGDGGGGGGCGRGLRVACSAPLLAKAEAAAPHNPQGTLEQAIARMHQP